MFLCTSASLSTNTNTNTLPGCRGEQSRRESRQVLQHPCLLVLQHPSLLVQHPCLLALQHPCLLAPSPNPASPQNLLSLLLQFISIRIVVLIRVGMELTFEDFLLNLWESWDSWRRISHCALCRFAAALFLATFQQQSQQAPSNICHQILSPNIFLARESKHHKNSICLNQLSQYLNKFPTKCNTHFKTYTCTYSSLNIRFTKYNSYHFSSVQLYWLPFCSFHRHQIS